MQFPQFSTIQAAIEFAKSRGMYAVYYPHDVRHGTLIGPRPTRGNRDIGALMISTKPGNTYSETLLIYPGEDGEPAVSLLTMLKIASMGPNAPHWGGLLEKQGWRWDGYAWRDPKGNMAQYGEAKAAYDLGLAEAL